MPAAKKQRVAAGPAVTYGPDDPLPAAPKQPHKLTKKELKRPDPKDAEACKKFLPEFAKRLTVWRSWTNVGVMRPPPTLHELFMEIMSEKWFLESEWGDAWIGDSESMLALRPPENFCKALEELHKAEDLVVLGDGRRQPLILFDVDKHRAKAKPLPANWWRVSKVTFPQRGVPAYADGVMGDVEDSDDDEEGFIQMQIRYEQGGYHSP